MNVQDLLGTSAVFLYEKEKEDGEKEEVVLHPYQAKVLEALAHRGYSDWLLYESKKQVAAKIAGLLGKRANLEKKFPTLARLSRPRTALEMKELRRLRDLTRSRKQLLRQIPVRVDHYHHTDTVFENLKNRAYAFLQN